MIDLLHFLDDSSPLVVGGAVRDRLLGRETSDIDIVIDSDPFPAAEKIARYLNGSFFPLDKERGIVRITLPGGGHLDLAKQQGKDMAEDLDRRDFSVNALAVPLADWMKPNWNEFIVDRHQGLHHLAKREIVPVSTQIFKDDPLRLLRAFRIAAEIDFRLPSATLKAISKNKKRIRKPAVERKRDEMLRLFMTPRAAETLRLMDNSGLLEEIFPEAKKLRRTAPAYYGKGGVLKHTLDSVACFEDIVADKSWFPGLNDKIKAYLSEKISGHPRLAHCKWGLLLHDIGKPDTMKVIDGRLRFFEHEHVGAKKVKGIAKRFRWSSEEISRYESMVRNHMRPGSLATHGTVTDKAIHRFFRDLGDDAVAMLLVSLGDHLSYLSPAQKRRRNSAHEKLTITMIRRFYTQRETIVPPKILSGYDLMKAFHLPPSRLIGDLLTDLTEAQSEGKIHTRDQALSYLKGRLTWHQQRSAS